MRFTSSRSNSRAMLRRAALLAGGLLFAAAAGATTFYKWTDADGNVHYSDKPPKGHVGEVTTLEVDPGAQTVAPPVADKPVPDRSLPTAIAPPPGGVDILTQRRATRAKLEANLDAARERLDVAQKALSEAGEPQGDEWQYTVGGPPAPGSAPRANCHAGADGKVICPGRVPSGDYYARVQQLEESVKRAQAEVDAAEIAYRKGVD